MMRLFWIVLIGAGLTACSSVNINSYSPKQYPITSDFQVSKSIDSIISPYRDSLEVEMLEVIGKADNNFERGRPNGALNNWIADAMINSQMIEDENNPPIICLLNYGSLRNPLNKGDITVGDVYQLMPFDNVVVWAKMPMSSKKEIENYINTTGGEPIAGAAIENGELQFENSNLQSDYFWVITSDYLLNGGDHMDFFKNRIEEHNSGILLRDLLLEAVKEQGTLNFSNEIRIKI